MTSWQGPPGLACEMSTLHNSETGKPWRQPSFCDAVCCACRGGPRSADHVDILGHMDVVADVLTIAAGRGDELQDKIISDVARIADNIPLGADGCCD